MSNLFRLINLGINGGTGVKLLNAELTYGWKNLTSADPSNSAFGNVETQFSGWENPVINLRFYIPIDNNPSGYMTWSLWNQYAKNQYDGTVSTKTYLDGSVGNNDTLFSSYAASSTATSTYPIPVQIKSYTLRISPDESRNGKVWIIDAQLQETQ